MEMMSVNGSTMSKRWFTTAAAASVTGWYGLARRGRSRRGLVVDFGMSLEVGLDRELTVTIWPVAYIGLFPRVW